MEFMHLMAPFASAVTNQNIAHKTVPVQNSTYESISALSTVLWPTDSVKNVRINSCERITKNIQSHKPYHHHHHQNYLYSLSLNVYIK